MSEPAETPRRALPQRLLLHYGHGLLMGTADVIPGVSGGTVSLIVGIYERLILSIAAVAGIPAAVARAGRQGVLSQLRKVHWSLVIPLGLGIVSAILVGARLIPALTEQYAVESRAIFFGLIAGSLIVPWRRINRHSGFLYLVAAVSAIVVFFIVGLPPRDMVDPSLVVVAVVAAIAITAMILPGVSGAFLLLVMGMYEVTLNALNARDLVFILVFGTGAVLGLGIFSQLIGFCLRRFPDVTMAALIGLMVGGLRALWPYLGENRELYAPPADSSVLWIFGLMIASALFVLLVTRGGKAADQAESDTAPAD